MAGSLAPQTMQVHGVINQQSLVMLVNLGSTHNFIKERLAEKLGLTCNMEKRFNVKVACGERISCKGRCIGVQVRIQGVTLDIDFYLLPLEGYEVVLGAQWLRTLGMIEWDFSKLLMRFQYGGKRISLQGMTNPLKQVDGNKEERILKGSKHGAFMQFHAIAMGRRKKWPAPSQIRISLASSILFRIFLRSPRVYHHHEFMITVFHWYLEADRLV